MAKQSSSTSSWHDNDATHLPSHQSRTPTTLISSKLHHQTSPLTSASPISPSRNNNLSRNLHRLPTHILLLILLTCIVPLTKASTIYIPEQMVERPRVVAPAVPEHSEDLTSSISRLARSGPLLVDLSPPPAAAVAHGHDWTLATVEDMRKRQVGGDEVAKTTTSSSKQATSTKAASTSTKAGESSTSTSTSASSTSSIAVAEETGSTPLPQIFDNGFSANITDSCSTFMNSMLNNETFKACLPFSLLLQNSNTFFQTTKSVLLTTRLLDYTCAANTTLCTSVLTSFATNITQTTSCASDIANNNPLITQAHLGLLAYKPLFTASCLRNAKTSSYCFADAITNKTSPTDGQIYHLPLNTSLPDTSTPTCSGCLRDTMAVFSSSDDGTGGGNAALAHTYADAAVRINSRCGAGFVNATLAVAVVKTGGSPLAVSAPHGGFLSLITLLVVVVGSWLL